jgi:RNA polymerase sigma factor (sigma-70 family)
MTAAVVTDEITDARPDPAGRHAERWTTAADAGDGWPPEAGWTAIEAWELGDAVAGGVVDEPPDAPPGGQPDGRPRGADAGEIDELVARYSQMLRAIGRQYRLTPEEREDAVQSTWLQLIRKYATIREHDKLAGWLATTMRRNCLGAYRQQHRQYATWELPLDHCDQVARDIADTVVSTLTSRRLWEALATLPARQRDLLIMQLDPREPGYSEISRVLGMPIGSIGPVRGRALRRLRLLLEDLEPAG